MNAGEAEYWLSVEEAIHDGTSFVQGAEFKSCTLSRDNVARRYRIDLVLDEIGMARCSCLGIAVGELYV